MVKISIELVEKIQRLGVGSIEDQKSAVKIMRENIFLNRICIDGSLIPLLLPLIVRLIASEDQFLQQNGAYFVEAITNTSNSRRNDKENTELVIEHDATVNLVNCLSLSRPETLIIQCLKCLVNISFYFPAKIAETENALQSIIKCMEIKNGAISYCSAEILKNVAMKCKNSVSVILQAGGVASLKNLLESKNLKFFEVSLEALINIMCLNAEACRKVLDPDLGILNLMEPVFIRFFDDTKKPSKKRRSCLTATKKNNTSKIKYLTIRFFIHATYFNVEQIDMDSILVIDNIVDKKPSYIPTLINSNTCIVSLLLENLKSENFVLLVTVLEFLYNLIRYSGYDETVRENVLSKYIECKIQEKLKEFIKANDEKKLMKPPANKNFRQLPEDILRFVVRKIKTEPGVVVEKVEETEPENQNLRGQESLSDIENGSEFDEVTDPDFDDNNMEAQEIVITEANAINIKNEAEQGFVAGSENSIVQFDAVEESNVETQEFSTETHASVVENVKIEPGIFEKIESDEFNEREEIRSIAAVENDNVVEFDEFASNVSDHNNVDIQESQPTTPLSCTISFPASSNNIENIVITEAGNEQNEEPAIFIQNGTRRSKRTLNESEQAVPPLCKKRRQNGQFLHQNQNIVKYYSPSEKDIVSYCRDLEVDFDRKLFHEFHSQINFETITPDSKPNRIYAINDKSGFGCFSVFFTGTESSAEKIRNKIFNKFINFLNPAENSSNEKLQQILNSNSMTAEHLETLVKWFKFRIVVYSNENGWEKYGVWNSENDPIFVLNKIQSGNENLFEIVLSFD